MAKRKVKRKEMVKAEGKKGGNGESER